MTAQLPELQPVLPPALAPHQCPACAPPPPRHLEPVVDLHDDLLVGLRLTGDAPRLRPEAPPVAGRLLVDPEHAEAALLPRRDQAGGRGQDPRQVVVVVPAISPGDPSARSSARWSGGGRWAARSR